MTRRRNSRTTRNILRNIKTTKTNLRNSSSSLAKEYFISRSDCDMRGKIDLIWQLTAFTAIVELKGNSWTLSKARVPPKENYGDWCSKAGLILHSFLNLGETVTAEKYCREIDQRHQKLKRRCPAHVNRKGSVLLHDKSRPHVA